jgi:hypothetical protein
VEFNKSTLNNAERGVCPDEHGDIDLFPGSESLTLNPTTVAAIEVQL